MESMSSISPASASNCLRVKEPGAGGVNWRLLAVSLVSAVFESAGGGAAQNFLDRGLIVFEPSNTGGYSLVFINDVWLLVTVCTIRLLQEEGNGKMGSERLGSKKQNLVREFITCLA